jgi:PhnB protein
MTTDVSPIPNFLPPDKKSITLRLLVQDVGKAMDFYNSAFSAEEVLRLTNDDGLTLYGEMRLNDTIVVLERAEAPALGDSAIFQLYVGDVEGVVEEAERAGCVVIAPIALDFDGDRSAQLRDPFGHRWIISTHVESFTPAQIHRRFRGIF